MGLRVVRGILSSTSAIGKLYLDGAFECYTLEDAVRAGIKVPGKTAIPDGRYRLTIDWSNRFKRLMPHVCGVPNFEGVRIHCGNTDRDTEGCLLVGTSHGVDVIGGSRAAFDALFPKLQAAVAAGPVWITYETLAPEKSDAPLR
jgi:Steigviridae/Suoliviridae L,D-carboxypeptidase/transpeptidase